MKKTLAIILSLLIATSLFVGCGKSDEDKDTVSKESKNKSEHTVKKAEDKAKESEEKSKENGEDAEREAAESNESVERTAEASIDGGSNSGNVSQGSTSQESNNNVNAPSVEPEATPAPAEPTAKYVTLSITCYTLLNNMDKVAENKKNIIPSDGVILSEIQVEIEDGDTVFDVLLKQTRNNRIHMDFVETPLYNSAYIKGIANIYEFDGGDLSGWMYSVNGVFPNFGVSQYDLQNGDRIEFKYTCDLGKDL